VSTLPRIGRRLCVGGGGRLARRARPCFHEWLQLHSTSENRRFEMAAKKKAKQAAAVGKPVKVKKKKTSRGK
jgi:hypothetical protein